MAYLGIDVVFSDPFCTCSLPKRTCWIDSTGLRILCEECKTEIKVPNTAGAVNVRVVSLRRNKVPELAKDEPYRERFEQIEIDQAAKQ